MSHPPREHAHERKEDEEDYNQSDDLVVGHVRVAWLGYVESGVRTVC